MPQIKDMTTSGTSGRQYGSPNIPYVILLHTDGDHSPTDEGREVAPLRKREYMKTHERSDKRNRPYKVET